MTRYFYPASRSHHALSMLIDFGMKFKKRTGFWSLEGLLSITGAGGYQIEIAQESLHLLELQVGDLVRWHCPGAFDAHVQHIEWVKRGDSVAPGNRVLEIIKRDGKPFMWPEVEP